ncbi:hypothetical protein [Flavobacterium selenitireducens]|uniref:hypothetical protein n=1 Tax=Flavobacterium selenitireducens TaxID=2722704 RepID=UPI00168B75AB|nr:hypothetical protein [Flavobacterium selenitireducens]MBD3582208.1 hypothetical protein [Flavobacterium selenitireducens]
MKKIKFQAIAVMAFLAMGAASCSDDDSNTSTVTKVAYVTDITGPSEGDVNQELSYVVKYSVDNACGEFQRYVESATGTTKTIELVARYASNNCEAAAVIKDTVYKFKPTAAGAYNLKFKKSATEFITKAVTVE